MWRGGRGRIQGSAEWWWWWEWLVAMMVVAGCVESCGVAGGGEKQGDRNDSGLAGGEGRSGRSEKKKGFAASPCRFDSQTRQV